MFAVTGAAMAAVLARYGRHSGLVRDGDGTERMSVDQTAGGQGKQSDHRYDKGRTGKMDGIVASVIFNLSGTIIGGLITFLVSRRYYVRASQDLSEETEQLKKESTQLILHTNMLLRIMEEQGWVTLTRDESGRIRGRIAELSGRASVSLTAVGSIALSSDEAQSTEHSEGREMAVDE